MQKLKTWAIAIKRNICALYFASHDPCISPVAKWFIIAIIAYALSPIDLIPDFIPIIGYLDDLLLLPLGISIAIQMIPNKLWRGYLQHADAGLSIDSPHKRIAAILIVFTWACFAAYMGHLTWNWAK